MRWYAVLIYVFLYVPIALIVLFCFNCRPLCHGLQGFSVELVRQGVLQPVRR